MPALLDFFGIAGVDGLQFFIAIGIAQIHSGIVPEIGLGDAELDSVCAADSYGQEGDPCLVPFGKMDALVVILERVEERISVPADFCVGNPCCMVLREDEVGSLAYDVDGLPGYEPVCGTVIENSYHEIEIPGLEAEFVVFFEDGRPLEEQGVDRAGDALAYRLAEFGSGAHRASVPEIEGNFGRGEQDLPIEGDAPEKFFPRLHGHFQPLVGRGDGVFFGIQEKGKR